MNRNEPDLTKVTDLESAATELKDWKDEFSSMTEAACDFVRSFAWCAAVVETYAGIVIPGVVGVYLHRIISAREEVDPWVWSIVGDVPPAYIALDDTPNPASALDAYIGAMSQWIDAVRLGQPVDELIPVNVPAKAEFADMLESRLQYLGEMLERDYAPDLE